MGWIARRKFLKSVVAAIVVLSAKVVFFSQLLNVLSHVITRLSRTVLSRKLLKSLIAANYLSFSFIHKLQGRIFAL